MNSNTCLALQGCGLSFSASSLQDWKKGLQATLQLLNAVQE